MFQRVVYTVDGRRPAYTTIDTEKNNDKNIPISTLHEIQNAAVADEMNSAMYSRLEEEDASMKTKTGRIKKRWKPQYTEQENQQKKITLARYKDIDIRNEVIYDGLHKWTPAHMFVSPNAPWWTHFLIAEDKPTLIKCKHCSTIIQLTNSATVNKLPIVHLETNHYIRKTVNYYDKETQEKLLLYVPDLSIFPSPSIFSTSKVKEYIFDPQNRYKHIPDQLADEAVISVMMISQNIPLSFTEKPLFASLIDKIPNNNNTIHASDIQDNIVNISEALEQVLYNSIPHNFPMVFNIERIVEDPAEAYPQLKYTLEDQLLEILHASVFSLSYHIWGEKYFVISAQYFDEENRVQRTIPLSVTLVDLSKDQINGFFISQQFQEVYNRYPGLPLSTLTITLPTEEVARRVRTENIDPFPDSVTNISSNQLRVCVLTNICKSIEYLFGNYAKGANGTSHVVDSDPINVLLNLKDVDISASLFGKINSLYDEISSEPTQVRRFIDICESKNLEIPNLTPFNPHKPSTAIEFLSNFDKMSELLSEIEPYFSNEKLTQNDFRIAQLLISFLASAYSIVNRLLGDSTYLSILSVLLYHQVEKQLRDIIGEIPYSRYLNQFNRSLDNILQSQRSLLNIESTILGSFFIPSSLTDGNFPRKIFRTNNTSDILEFVTNIGLSLLKKFINTDKSSYNYHTETVDKTDNYDALIEGLPFVEFGNVTEKKAPVLTKEITILETIKDILRQDVETDLAHYMKSIYSEYPKLHDRYIEANSYEQHNLQYKKTGTSEILTPLQEFEFIHAPLCQGFLSRYLSSDIGLLFKVLLKIVCTETVSSIRSEYLYLNNFISELDDELLEPCVKIKILNEQVNINRDDLSSITLDQLCKYSL